MYTRQIPAVLLLVLSQAPIVFSSSWDCQVLPSEQRVEVDSQSGAKIIFVTTAPSSDTNFYFHNRSFL